ncbi:transcriptional repressor [Aeromicrobium sp.]|uniref:Fur family transcriptional regulator n=1 Tax=Aeromicrobium sp. TaxID=1871063 RepID=UPI0019C1F4AF|nr:transcriptional repressor [Aeromicrobium sp.]MBC7631849.1 transcriptional repressor [Aeromicrobium sp.]
MPDSPLSAARPVADLSSALAVLRENGGRVSTSRRALLQVLFDATSPLSVEHLAAQAVPSLDVPSTYRTLERLEEVGLVRHVHLGHGPGLYELTHQTEREYAWCESCGKAASIEPDRLDAARSLIEQSIGYRPRFGHFPLVGLCADCLSAGRHGHHH